MSFISLVFNCNLRFFYSNSPPVPLCIEHFHCSSLLSTTCLVTLDTQQSLVSRSYYSHSAPHNVSALLSCTQTTLLCTFLFLFSWLFIAFFSCLYTSLSLSTRLYPLWSFYIEHFVPYALSCSNRTFALTFELKFSPANAFNFTSLSCSPSLLHPSAATPLCDDKYHWMPLIGYEIMCVHSV